METSTRPKLFRFIFIPALLLSVVLAGSSALFNLAQEILIGQIGYAHIPALKMLVIFPQILLVLILLIASKKKSFEKVLRGTLMALMGVVLFAAGIVFFQAHLPIKETADAVRNLLPSSMVQMYEPVINNWPGSLLYVAIHLLSANLFSVLIWGFINRLTFFAEGIKYYILLALVLGIPSALMPALGLWKLSLMEGGYSDRSLILIGISAMALVIVALLIFNRSWKRLPDHFLHPKELVVPKKRFPFLTAAYLLAGTVIVGSLLQIDFISQLRTQFSNNTNGYAGFMGNYSMFKAFSTLIVTILWVALGSWLILKRGWKTTALWGSLSVLIGGLVFLGFAAVQSVSGPGQGIFNGLLIGTKSALFFPLIQIAYLYLPFQARFRTKVVTEMIVLPLMTALLVQGLIGMFGSMSSFNLYIKIFVPILLILLVIASRRIGSRLPAK